MFTTAKLTGILTDIFPIETSPNFVKRVFWLKEPDTERYPNHWQIELHQNDTDRLRGMKTGDRLEVEVEVRGRQYNKPGTQGKAIFVSLKAVGIRVLEQLEKAPQYKPPADKGGKQGNLL